MKLYPLLAVICLFFTLGCDKEDPLKLQKPADEVVKEQLTEALADESDLTGFITAFKDLDMEPEDVVNGITIFAPADTDGSGGRAASGSQTSELTSEELKGHIVKSLISAANLKDGDELTTLNGKLLLVSVNGEEIRVNGVLLITRDLASDEKYVVHKVEEILQHPVTAEEPASLTVTVWNSLKWSPEKPGSEVEAGVTVSLYASHADYVLGLALATQETNAEGKAVFSDLEGGTTYYIFAQKGDLSNIFHRSAEPVNGVYVGFLPDGLFQTQEEVDNHASQSDAVPGNFRYVDLNADGVINNDDKVPVPHLEATPVFSETEVEVIVGYENNKEMAVRDGADALQKLQASRSMLDNFHKTLVMTDGLLSDDAECATDPDWCAIDNFTFNPSHPAFMSVWNDAYANVGQLNLLLRDVPGLTFAEKEAVLAEAKGLRAYIYLQLASYFGDIPLLEGLKLGDEPRTSKQEVFALIENDLQVAADVLPASASGQALSSNAAKGLLARVALLQQKWAVAADFSDQVIQSAVYTLMGTSDEVFMEATNAEIIWDFSSDLSTEFSDYFYGRTFCPALRLAEVYLINAEANFEISGGSAGGLNSLNIIRDRIGLAPLAEGSTLEQARTALRETWRVEMSREGSRFANLVRWDEASATLNGKGYDFWYSLLPVPQEFMDSHPNLTQNMGY